MKDRIPANPGRVLITPENGAAAYYAILTRADNPTQEGTPLNKSALLTDETSANYGLGENSSVDEVLNILSRFNSRAANEFVWEKIIEGKIYYETLNEIGQTTMYNGSVGTCGKTIQINQTDGNVTITDVIAAKPFTESNASYWENKIPFYCQYDNEIRYIAGPYVSSGSAGIIFRGVSTVVINLKNGKESFGYVNNESPNAYPVSDGYTYVPMGKLGEKIMIASGAYNGTGTLGQSNPNSLTFNFVPKLLFIGSAVTNTGIAFLTATGGGLSCYGGTTVKIVSSVNGNTISWYSTVSQSSNGWEYQMNKSGTAYTYIAIG